MTRHDNLLDDEAIAANRVDARRAVVITIVGLATVLLAGVLVAFGGFAS